MRCRTCINVAVVSFIYDFFGVRFWDGEKGGWGMHRYGRASIATFYPHIRASNERGDWDWGYGRVSVLGLHECWYEKGNGRSIDVVYTEGKCVSISVVKSHDITSPSPYSEPAKFPIPCASIQNHMPVSDSYLGVIHSIFIRRTGLGSASSAPLS